MVLFLFKKFTTETQRAQRRNVFTGLGDNGPAIVSALRAAEVVHPQIYQLSTAIFPLPSSPGKGKE
jgi:hypothetical protein